MAKLPKKPKRPKRTSSLAVWKNYEGRVKAWEKKVSDIEKDRKAKEVLIGRL